MAASLSITIMDHWSDGKRIHVVGSVNVLGSGNYVSNGLLLNFVDPNHPTAIKAPNVNSAVSGPTPEHIIFGTFTGYRYSYNYVTGKVACFSSGGTQASTSSAWPETNFPFYGVFQKFVENPNNPYYFWNVVI